MQEKPGHLKAGDFIGEGCLTGRPRRVSTDYVASRFEDILK